MDSTLTAATGLSDQGSSGKEGGRWTSACSGLTSATCEARSRDCEGDTGSAEGSTRSDGARTLRSRRERNCPQPHRGRSRSHRTASWRWGAAGGRRSSDPATQDAVKTNHCPQEAPLLWSLDAALTGLVKESVFNQPRLSCPCVGVGVGWG